MLASAAAAATPVAAVVAAVVAAAALLLAATGASAAAAAAPPSHWSVRTAWPGCAPAIVDQGQCGDGSVLSAAAALGTAACGLTARARRSPGAPGQLLSATYIAECVGGSACAGSDVGVARAAADLKANGTLPAACAASGSSKAVTCPDRALASACSRDPAAATACCAAGAPRLYHAANVHTLPRAAAGAGAGHVAAWQQALMEHGPILVDLDKGSTAFQFYTGGVLTCGSGHLPVDGSAYLTGWGTDTAGKVWWELANTWGAAWGMDGYAHVADGACALGTTTSPLSVSAQPLQGVCGATCKSNADCYGSSCSVCHSTKGVCH